MGSLSLWHWLVVLAVVVVLFGGRGRLSALMHDIAKGLKAFKAGIEDEKHGKTKEKSNATKTPNKKKSKETRK